MCDPATHDDRTALTPTRRGPRLRETRESPRAFHSVCREIDFALVFCKRERVEACPPFPWAPEGAARGGGAGASIVGRPKWREGQGNDGRLRFSRAA